MDALEPRVLLNADTLAVQLASMPHDMQSHDILVQMVQETATAGTKAQALQQVQVIDKSNHGAVLAVGPLSEFSAVSIDASGTAGTVSLDLDSFGTTAAPSLDVRGNGMTALVIEHAAGKIEWQVNGDGTGSAAGDGAAVSFAGVSRVVGGGADVLHGPAPDTTWHVTGAGSGTLAETAGGPTTTFAGFNALDGAANNDDNFLLQPGGSVAGGIDGGAGGFDTVGYDGGSYASLISAPTGPQSGALTMDGVTTNYAGMEPVTSTAIVANMTFKLAGVGGQATLTDEPGTANMLQLSEPGQMETDFFAAPTGTLTIDLGSGGSHTLNLTGIDSRLISGLVVQTEGTGDAINVNTGLTTQGHAVSLAADTITLGGNDAINTTLANGNAGNVTLAGKTITLNAGSSIVATAGAGKSAGNVALTATDTTYRLVNLPINFTAKTLAITLTGASINAGNVTVSATATDLPESSNYSDIAAYSSGFTSTISGLLNQLPGDIISGLTGIDASVIQRGATTNVTLDNSTITSSGGVTIASNSAAASNVQAFAVGFNPKTVKAGVQIAVGYAEADASATTNIQGTTSITSANDVLITATAAATATSMAQASSNLIGEDNPNAVQVALAITNDQLTSVASLDNTVHINSGGNVNVSATGTTVSTPFTQTTGYEGGKAGVDLSFGFDNATVNSFLNGQITAAGTVSGSPAGSSNTATFVGNSSSAVNLANSTLYIPNNNLVTGQEVTYTPQSQVAKAAATPAGPIGGLAANGVYYVLVVDPNHIQLSARPPILLNPVGTNPNATHTLATTSTVQFDVGGIGSNNTIFLQQHGFSTGDTVTYHVLSGSSPIANLSDGNAYQVTVIDGDTFQLSQNGQVVSLAQNNSTGTYTFTDGTNVETLTLALVDPQANTITLAGNPFTEGQSVVYQSLTSADIGALQDGYQYAVHVVSSGVFQLLDPQNNNAVIALSSPSGATFHEIDYLNAPLTFNPATAVNPVTDTITVSSTAGLTTGTPVVYHTDPTITSTQQVPVQNVLNFVTSGISNNAFTITSHGFVDGDLLTYTVTPGSDAIAGLSSGTQYKVHVVDPNDFQLFDLNSGLLIPISQGSSTGTYTFADGLDTQTLTLGLVDSTKNTITVAGEAFQGGEQVLYEAITGPSIGAASGTQYKIQLVAGQNNTFQLLDLKTNAVVTLGTPGGADQHSLFFAAPASSGATATIADLPVGGLMDDTVYNVVVVDATHIRLATSRPNAIAALPITFTALGTGNADTLSQSTITNGIGNTASLSASDTASASPTTGQQSHLGRNINIFTSSDIILGAFDALRMFIAAKGQTGTAIQPAVSGSGFTAAGSIVLNDITHHVNALVGNFATASAPTTLSTPQSISNAASISQTEQAVSISSATIYTGRTGNAVAFAVAIGYFTNDAESVIGSNTVIDAGTSLSVTSDVNYAILVEPALIPASIPQGFIANGGAEINTLFDGTFGLGSSLLNSWAMAQASPMGDNTTSVDGSIVVNIYNDASHALIQSGAQINQTVAMQTASQAVAVAATIENTIIDLAGIGTFSLNINGAISTKGNVKADGAAAALTGGGLVDIFGRSSGKSIGGSIVVNDLNNDTLAQVGYGTSAQYGNTHPTAIYVGSGGGLSINGAEAVFRLDLAIAGGLATSSDATLAVAGSVVGFRERSSTISDLSAADLGLSVTGGGNVAVTSSTGLPSTAAPRAGTQVAAAGAIARGEGGATAIGISVAVNDIQRKTESLIGPDAASPGTASAGTLAITGGVLTDTAKNAGVIVGVGVAGVFVGGKPDPAPMSTTTAPSSVPPVPSSSSGTSSATSGQSTGGSTTSGIGIAGSAMVNVISDTTIAEIIGAGAITATTIAVAADDNSLDVVISGSVAVVISAGSGSMGGTGIAGAFSLNLITDDTEATVNGVTLTATNTNAAPGVPTVNVSASREGALDAVTAALDATVTASGNGFAGSFSVNLVTDKTNATVANTSILAAQDVAVSAADSAAITAIGGAVAVSTGAVGIGASIGYNETSAQTNAVVSGTGTGTGETSIKTGGLSVSAVNNNTITSVAVSAGAATGASGTVGGAFTLAINILASDPAVSTASTADGVTAVVENVIVLSSGAVSLLAKDNSVIQSIAGAVGIGTKASGFGIALSWNQVVLNVHGTIDNAQVTGSSVSVISESTQSAGLLNDKIAAVAVGAAISTSGTAAVGVSVAVNGVLNTITATIVDNATVTATGGDVDVTALDNATIQTLEGGAAIAPNGNGVGVGAGGAFVANTVTAEIAGASVRSQAGSVNVDATETAVIQALVIGLAGSQDVSVAGSLAAGIIDDTVLAEIGAGGVVTASGAVGVVATDGAQISIVAGQVAIALGGSGIAVGASIAVGTVLGSNTAVVSGTAQVGAGTNVLIQAVTTEPLSIIAVGGAIGSDLAVSGSVTVEAIDIQTSASVQDEPSLSATPVVTAGAANVTGSLQVLASNTVTLLGTAGAIAVGAETGGVGVGADVGVLTLTTLASIGRNDRIASGGSVIVSASESEQILSISAAGAVGAGFGIAGGAGISVLNLTTKAWIDQGAVVNAGNNVVVTAEDDATTVQVAGALGAGSAIGVGIAAAIGTINKETDAYVASGASVKAQAKGPATVANTGAIAAASKAQTSPASVTATFATSAVGAGGEITATNHGFQTGDEVVYDGGSVPLQNLQQNGIYYVIRDSANTFRLANSAADAQAGRAIPVSAGQSPANSVNTVQTYTTISAPAVQTPDFNGTSLVTDPFGAPVTAGQSGVVVTAVSTNTLSSAGGAAAGGAVVGIPVAAAIDIHQINTIARIDGGASITSGGNVNVAAGRTYRELALGLGLGGSETVALTPALALPVLTGTTEAIISGDAADHTSVTATGDIAVQAQAAESVLVIAIGVAGSGIAAIGGSASVIDMHTTTEALITGADGEGSATNPVIVQAGGNVLVSATDTASGGAIAGAVGLGIAGGGGAGAFALTITGDTTQALIQDGARVDAGAKTAAVADVFGQNIRGVGVQAYTNHSIDDIAGSGAGGFYLGVAGAVDYEQISDTTLAAIRNGAEVDQNSALAANAAQTVDVAARDDLKELVVAGALGGSVIAGVGAGVDVNSLENSVQAFIAASDVSAQNLVSVNSQSTRDISVYAIAVGAGLVGLGGGISVLSIGSGVSGSYTVTNQSNGQSSTSSALSGGSNGSVLDSLNGAINGVIGAVTAPPSSALPPIDPATAVSGNTITFSQPVSLQTGQSVTYDAEGGQPIGGLADSHIYFVIVLDSTHIQLADSYQDALSGNAKTLNGAVATGTAQRFTAGQNDVDAQASGMVAANAPTSPANSLPTGTVPAGTTAAIDGGAVITASSVAVNANQTMTILDTAGGGAAGGVAIGVGLAVINIDSNVTALVGPSVVIDGLGGAGSLSVTAMRTTTISGSSIAGAVSGLVSLGSAIAYATDTSQVSALLGADLDGSGNVVGGTATQAASVGGSGFATVTVTATQHTTEALAIGAAALAVAGGLGAGSTEATLATTTQALIGDYTVIGAGGAPIGAVNVTATGVETIQPYQSGKAFTIALGGGILSGAAGVATASATGTTTAAIGQNAAITAVGGVNVQANGTANASGIEIDGGAIGALAIGVVLSTVTASPTVTARIGTRSKVNASAITVDATGNVTAITSGTPAAGGVLFAGAGGLLTVNANPVVIAAVAANAVLTAAGEIDVVAIGNTDGEATMTGGAGAGGIETGVGNVVINLGAIETADIGADASLNGVTVMITATGTDQAHGASSNYGGSGVGSVNTAYSAVTENDTTLTHIESGAQITASGAVSILSQGTLHGTSNPTAQAYALAAGVPVGTGYMNTVQTVQTTIDGGTASGPNTLIDAGSLSVVAEIATLSTNVTVPTNGGGFVAVATSNASTNVVGEAQVGIGAATTLIGASSAYFSAQADEVDITAESLPTSGGIVPVASDNVSENASITTDVNAAAGASVTSQNLYVQSVTQNTPTFTATPTRVNDGVTTTDTPNSFSRTNVRTIEWNAAINVAPEPDPVLYVNADGTINAARTINVTAHQLPGEILVDPIVNNPSGSGTLNFYISPSTYDSQNGTNSIISYGKLTGVSGVIAASSFARVTLTNTSSLNLVLQGIEPTVNTASLGAQITINVPNGGDLFTYNVKAGPLPTIITIANTNPAGGDVGQQDLIDDGLGSTTISAAGGSILEVAPGLIIANSIRLSAQNAIGAAGTGALLIEDATALNAAAATGPLYVSQTGSLQVGTISAGTIANLQASGAITEGTTQGAAVSAPTVQLFAAGGGIGTTGALAVTNDTAPVTLTAHAIGGIAITGGAGGLALLSVSNTNGDILISVPDLTSAGQNITLGAAALVSAAAGSVKLDAGDNVTMTQGATLTAANTVSISGDVAHAEGNGGTTITLTNGIRAASVAVTGGVGANNFLIDGAVSATTINANTGSSVVDLGTNAGSGNTGGTLRQFTAGLTVAGAGVTTVNVDDSGEAAALSGTLQTGGSLPAGAVGLSGLGGGPFTVQGATTLNVALGSGTVGLAVLGTPAGLLTNIALGAGADSISVGAAGSKGTLAGILGGVTLAGSSSGTGTLTINDAAGTALSGTYAAGGLTGLGLTPSSPLAGLAWTKLSSVVLNLPASAQLAVTGSAQTTMINAGSNNSIAVDGDLATFVGALSIHDVGTANTIALSVTSETQTPFTISSATAAGVTTTSVAGPNGAILADNLASLVVTEAMRGGNVTVTGSSVPLTINTPAGNGIVTVAGATQPVTVNLGLSNNQVTISGAAANVTVNGTANAVNTVTIDRSAIATPLTGSVTASSTVTTVAGLLDNAASVLVGLGVSSLNLKLGSGNNQLTINDAASAAALSVTGGISNDAITIASIPTGKTTAIAGGGGVDRVTLSIPGAPVSGQFAGLALSAIDTLVVDNSSYTAAPVAFVRSDVPTGTHTVTLTANNLDLVDTTGARAVKIIGGLVSDTLDVTSNSVADESGTVNGNEVTLSVGGTVISGGTSAVITYVPGEITFNNLSSAQNKYTEDGKIFVAGSSSNGMSAEALTPVAIGGNIAAAALQAGEMVTLTDPSGSPFSLSGLTLTALGGGAPANVRLNYTTHSGQTGSINVPVNGQATSFAGLSDLSSVSLMPTANVAIDNIIVAEQAQAAAAVTYAATPTFTLGGQVEIVSDNGAIYATQFSTANIAGSTSNGRISSPGITTSLANGIETIHFAGNLVIAAGTVIYSYGANLVSLTAGGDISVGNGAKFYDGSQEISLYGGAPTGSGAGGSGGAVAAGGRGGAGGPGGIVGTSPQNGQVYGAGGNGGLHDNSNVTPPSNGYAGQTGGTGGVGGSGTPGNAGMAGGAGVGAAGSGGAADPGGQSGPAPSTGVAGGPGGGSGGAGSDTGVIIQNGGSGGGNGGDATIGNDAPLANNGSSPAAGGSSGMSPNQGAVLAAGGGGSGGGGGGGGEGGGGGSGGGSGGGGGGGGYNYTLNGAQYPAGASGGNGGVGGTGGTGGTGGAGGNGGAGGAGGGGIELLASGALTFASTTIDVTGSNGSSPTTGPGAAGGATASSSGPANGGSPGNAETVDGVSGYSGGYGGNGKAGGAGAAGGLGAVGAAGGGGAGGVAYVAASDLEANGLVVNAAGGAGGTGATAALNGAIGATGRAVEGSNTNLTLNASGAVTAIGGGINASSTVASQTLTTQGALSSLNPYFVTAGRNLSTPNLTGLVGGAASAGILNITTTQAQALIKQLNLVSATSPSGATLAVVRLTAGSSIGVAGFQTNYTGFDLVLVVNLTDNAIGSPTLGIASTAAGVAAKSLAIAGVTQQGALSALNAYGVFATLVPHSNNVAEYFSVNGTGLPTMTPTALQATADAGNGSVAYAMLATPTAVAVTLPGLDTLARNSSTGTIYGGSTAGDALVVLNPAGGVQQYFDLTKLPGGGVSNTTVRAVSLDQFGTALYAAATNTSGQSVVYGFSVNASTGNLTYVSTLPTNAPITSLASVPGETAPTLIASGSAGSIGLYGSTGSPGTLTEAVLDPISGTPVPPSGPAVNASTPDPLSGLTYVATSGAILRLVPTPQGAFPAAAFAVSGNPTALAVGAKGMTIYAVAGSGVGTLFVINATTGAVTQTLTNGTNGATGLAGASGIAVTQDGSGNDQYVLVSSATGNSVAVYQVTAKGLIFEQLVRNGTSGVGSLEAPGAILLNASGTAAYVATAGYAGAPGGLTTLTLTASAPAPQTLITDFAGIGNVGLDAGQGNDSIALLASPSATVQTLRINTQQGADSFTANALGLGSTIVDLGAGNDTATLLASTPNATLTLSGGAGSDTINLVAAGAGSTYHIHGGEAPSSPALPNTTAADGADVVNVYASKLAPNAVIDLHGDNPSTSPGDTLNYYAQGQTQVPGTLLFPGGVIPETVTSAGSAVITYDTFEGSGTNPAVKPLTLSIAPVASFNEGTGTSIAATALESGAAAPLNGPILWNLSGNGSYGEEVGSTIKPSWGDLVSLGITGPGTYQISAKASDTNGQTAYATATLTVLRVAPTVSRSGPATVALGAPYNLTFGGVENGNEQIQSFTVNWGDGTTQTFGAAATAASHVYTSISQPTIQVSLTDSYTPHGSATPIVTTFPAAPLPISVIAASSDVTIAGPFKIAEGQSLTLSGSAQGNPISYQWIVNGISEATAKTTNGQPGSLTLPWSTTQFASTTATDIGAGTYPVQLTVTYADKETATANTTLTIVNTPPVVAATNSGPVVQGNGATVTLNITSVALYNQTGPYSVSVSLNGSSSVVLSGTYSTDKNNNVQLTLPAGLLPDHGTYVVSGFVTDREGGKTAYSTAVVVTPVPEILTATGAPTVNEGSTYTLTLGSTHPAPESVQYWIVDWGDGTKSTFPTATFNPTATPPSTTTPTTHVYQAIGTYTIGLTAYDQDGPTQTSAKVQVLAVAPVLTLNPVASVQIGKPSTLTGTITEPGLGNSYALTINWGDGTPNTVIAVQQTNPNFELSHIYAAVATYTINGSATDTNKQTATASVPAQVTPLPLAVSTLSFATPSIPEGGLPTTVYGTNGQPNQTTITPAILNGVLVPSLPGDTATVLVNWGDGSAATAATVNNTMHSFTASHLYLDNPAGQPNGSYTASVTAKDENGVVATGSTAIEVFNVAPSVTAFAPEQATINEGGTVIVDGAFTDPGVLDTHTATIKWGDGSETAATVNDKTGTFTASHLYANNLAYVNGAAPAYTLSASVVDKDGGTTNVSSAVTVDNVLPSVSGLAVKPVQPLQGSTFTLTGAVTDPGVNDPETVTVKWGDGTTSTVTANPTTRLFSVDHVYTNVVPAGQTSASETITATSTDDVGPGAPASLTVKVIAVPLPVSGLTITPGSIKEGGSVNASGSFADPVAGASETVQFDWSDGTTSAGTVTGSTYAATHVYANQPVGVQQGAFAVIATVLSSTGASGVATGSVTVADVAPSITGLSTPAAINEGGTVTISGTVVDPGLLDNETVQVVWGDNNSSAAIVNQATRAFTASHTYLNNPAGIATGGAFAINAIATDDVGEVGGATTAAIVNNVAPTPTALMLSSGTVGVGQPVTLTGKITDPGILDGESAVVTWGDGSKSTVTVDPATRTFSIAHSYAGITGSSQSFPIVVTATDSDGGVGSASTSVNVSAAAPSLASLAFTPNSINEGSAATLAGTVAGLPAADAATVAIVWGDGSTQSVSLAAGTTSFAINHVYLDNPTGQASGGSFVASAKLTDANTTLSASASASITVNNVAPVITSFTDASSSTNKVAAGQALGYSLVFTDPGALDTHTVTIGWGDGSKASVYTVAAGQLTFNPTHTYGKAGTFYVTVALVDKDGGAAAGKATIAYVGAAAPATPAAVMATSAAPAASTTATTTSSPAPAALTVKQAAATLAAVPATAASGSKPAAAKSPILAALAMDQKGVDVIRLVETPDVRIVSQPHASRPALPAATLFDDEDGMPPIPGEVDLSLLLQDQEWIML